MLSFVYTTFAKMNLLKLKNKLKMIYMLNDDIKELLQKKKLAKNPFVQRNENTFVEIKKNPFRNKVMLENSLLFKIALNVVYLIFCFFLLFKFRNKSGSLVLIYSLTFNQIFRNGSCQSLQEFLLEKRFGLNRNSTFLVEHRSLKRQKSFENCIVTRDISLHIYANYCKFSEKLYVFAIVIQRFFCSFLFLIIVPNFSLVIKEFVFDHSILRKKQDKLFDKVLTTQSQLIYQPLIFSLDVTKKKRIMIWYSANSIPIKYKENNNLVLGYSDVVFQNLKVDEHWVWDQSNADYLEKMTEGKAMIKGSMMFYSASPRKNTLCKLDVLLFDVTPIKNFPISNIYNEENVSKFVTDVVSVIREMKNYPFIKIGLKTKRRTTNFHSEVYSQMLENYYNSGLITELNYNENIYDLIANAKVVIAYPFTSPVYIAKELGVACVFYSPTNLLRSQTSYYGVKYIESKDILKKFLEKSLMLIP